MRAYIFNVLSNICMFIVAASFVVSEYLQITVNSQSFARAIHSSPPTASTFTGQIPSTRQAKHSRRGHWQLGLRSSSQRRRTTEAASAVDGGQRGRSAMPYVLHGWPQKTVQGCFSHTQTHETHLISEIRYTCLPLHSWTPFVVCCSIASGRLVSWPRQRCKMPSTCSRRQAMRSVGPSAYSRN